MDADVERVRKRPGCMSGRSRNRIVFLYGFAKNERTNITDGEREALSIVAGDFIDASDQQVAALIANGRIFELTCESI